MGFTHYLVTRYCEDLRKQIKSLACVFYIPVNIQAEKDTIAAYQQLIERIRKNNPEKLTQSATVAIQLLNKIVSDERVHVRILSELAQSVAAEEGKEA